MALLIFFVFSITTVFPTSNAYAISSSPAASLIEPTDIVTALEKAERRIEENLKNKRIPGCAVAVVYKNNIIFIHGYGVRTLGKEDKIDLDTVFQLGSVSKPIAATLAAVLEEKGLVNFNTPISQYLPGFALQNQSVDSLNISHILSHTSGVPRSGFNHLIETHTPYSNIVTALQRTPTVTAPGRKYDYHNAMYGLLSEIIEVKTHQTFENALKTNLLLPLHMHHTSASYDGLFINQKAASPHTRNGKGSIVPSEPYSQGYYTVAPAGGINSTIRDMAVFLKAQLGGYPNILSRNLLEKIQAPQITTKGSFGGRSENPAYGLGWKIVDYADQKLVYHTGWVKGFTNLIAFMPEQQLGIVVLHNSDTRFARPLVMSFFDTALGLPETKETAPPKMGKKGQSKNPIKKLAKSKKKTKQASELKKKIKGKAKATIYKAKNSDKGKSKSKAKNASKAKNKKKKNE